MPAAAPLACRLASTKPYPLVRLSSSALLAGFIIPPGHHHLCNPPAGRRLTQSASNPFLVRIQSSMAVSSGMVFSVRPPAPAARPCACSATAAAGGAARARADGGGGAGAKWWAPLLGWSGQPDYIDAHPDEPLPRGSARRFGVLTEDKARRLRVQMMETESFHDAMYHSAIASRLASAAPDAKR